MKRRAFLTALGLAPLAAIAPAVAASKMTPNEMMTEVIELADLPVSSPDVTCFRLQMRLAETKEMASDSYIMGRVALNLRPHTEYEFRYREMAGERQSDWSDWAGYYFSTDTIPCIVSVVGKQMRLGMFA